MYDINPYLKKRILDNIPGYYLISWEGGGGVSFDNGIAQRLEFPG